MLSLFRLMDIDLLSEEQLILLRTEVANAENIVICCHVSPDGDALGSCLGWAEYLRHEGKDPAIIVPDQYPDFLQWLPNSEKVIRYDKRTAEANALIAAADHIFFLDLNDISRTEWMAGALTEAKARRIVFDHHPDPVMEGVLMVSRPDLCSTSEIVCRLVMQLGAFDALGKHFAVPVYCGMMTDTGGFTFNSTRPEIYHLISLLLTKHINKDKIYRNVYNNYSEDRMRLTGYVLYKKLRYISSCHAAFFTLTRQDLARFHFIRGDAEGLVNMPLQIKGLKLSISLREDTAAKHLIRVSLRSVDDFPCNEMAAEFFNGGGHLNASGGKLHCSVDEAEQITMRAIEAYESKLK